MQTNIRSVMTGVAGFVIGALVSTDMIRGESHKELTGAFAHVAFVVRNVDKSAHALGDMFGVEVPPSQTVRDVAFPPSYNGLKMNGKFIIMNINGVRFEMIEPLDGPSPWKDFLAAHGEGVHHLGFSVPNAQDARRMLEAKGGKWTQAYNDTAAYVDMEPAFPVTFEVVGPR